MARALPTDERAGDPEPHGEPARERLAEAHRVAVADLRAAYAALPPDARVRLAKRTSNLFRFRPPTAQGLDVSPFDGVLHVDTANHTADVGGMTTYEHLVDATLPYGLMPKVVPQLKTITLGGAVAGLGIESSSFHAGLPHESVRDMEILTGTGEVVLARPDGPHADLYYGFPNSYGTLGYALRLTIDLAPVGRYVRLRHLPFSDAEALLATLAEVCEQGEYTGEPVDFVDGVAFSRDELYLTLGAFTDMLPTRAAGNAQMRPATSDYTGMAIYYQSIRRRREDHLLTRDYLWRWDTDWFWCSRAFGVQRPFARRLWPRRWRRSDVYRRLVALDNRYGVSARIERYAKRPPREAVIQDVELPVANTAAFLDFFHREIDISPVWLCPLRTKATWPLYPLSPGQLYVNVGFWSTVALPDGAADGHHNRLIERELAALGGHKSLYSTAFYEADEFWRRYNGEVYRELKGVYDPDGRLGDLYEKCVRGR